VLFGLAAIAQFAMVLLHLPVQVSFVSTWLVALLLAIWIWRSRGPRLLVAALLLCWVGDVLGNPRLIGLGPAVFLVSVAAFAAALVVLAILFVRNGALSRPLPKRGWVVVPYLVVGGAVLGVAWGDLDLTLRIVGIGYVLLLVAMATTGFLLDTGIGIGAALLLATHLLVVLEVGGVLDGTATEYRVVFGLLYLAGLLTLAIGFVRDDSRTGPLTEAARWPASATCVARDE